MSRMLSLKQASSETGLSYYCLRNLCLENKVAHITSGTKYLINADRLADYLNSTGQEKKVEVLPIEERGSLLTVSGLSNGQEVK